MGFKNYRQIIVLLSDILLIVLSFFLAFLIRFDGIITADYMAIFLMWAPALIIIRLLFFHFFDLYSGLWRYASVSDLLNILKAVAGSSVTFILIVVFARGLVGFPRSVFFIDTLLMTFFVGGNRFIFRVYREIFARKKQLGTKNLLIIGAGDAGYAILHELKNSAVQNYNVVGFIDDEKLKQNMNIQGVTVLGTKSDIRRVANSMKVDEIIIAIPSASRHDLKPIMAECEKTKAKIKIVPSMEDIINGKLTISQIREVRIEDLLGREVVDIDTDNIRKYILGKEVLVTGAGGSIGSEICRQVLKYEPKSLILFGRGEHSIYEIHGELADKKGRTELIQVIGGNLGKAKLDNIFKKYMPKIVFHAGADKQVPLLEINPDEAVFNNVIGTKNIVEISEKYGVEKVVCISTDKAADPVSVMGCAKRISEIIIQNTNNPVTTSIGVRFGNVLGSRGSVIPLFRKQIASGGPVTVTHPEMIRYFMTIPEAAQLVLQSGAMGKCGDIYLLDMGSPVKIIDLAKQMIKLSGFEPDKDIQIKFIGLRKGEKLKESLTGRDEKLFRTEHPKIFVLSTNGKTPKLSEKDIEELHTLAVKMDDKMIINKLKEIVPNYEPS